ncbi:hypothetical protein [Oceanimonas sp. GK1]|uniref:hypothetical protein n=1 Tax=Oceanimonas sp. (strain GK1 / IBRC-M 10197) TaxID=511062 RepID=UPI0011D19A60|nr:hypothetical protein [Oceanimonas sp. GK1]
MSEIKLSVEESVYLAYRDGGGESILHSHCNELGITIDDAKQMIRRQYALRKESGKLEPYDRSI